MNFGGAVKSGISLLACPDAKEGDYCLTHAGSALSVIDEESARETLELLREYSAL
ncbi:MAG: HypC/HybG/HupF family hydrogenase formation chaperone [Candidatus Paceibacterota bacterium]